MDKSENFHFFYEIHNLKGGVMMSNKILSLQKLSTRNSDSPDKKSVLSIFICEGGQGSSVSLYACTSLGCS
ncbi:MAG: hypothetical protein ACQEWT_18510 [Bacillota bacterium]